MKKTGRRCGPQSSNSTHVNPKTPSNTPPSAPSISSRRAPTLNPRKDSYGESARLRSDNPDPSYAMLPPARSRRRDGPGVLSFNLRSRLGHPRFRKRSRKDKRTGKVVTSPRWTIEYRADGRPVSEPARSPDYAVAEALLRRRIAEIENGSYGGADARTVRIKRLLDLLLEHFKENKPRSLEWGRKATGPKKPTRRSPSVASVVLACVAI